MAHFDFLSQIMYAAQPRRNRLASQLSSFRLELARHKVEPNQREKGLLHWKDIAETLLEKAEEALNGNRIDEGWRSFLSAARMEIYGLKDEERKVRAAALAKEAKEKLTDWRQEATLDVLNSEQAKGRNKNIGADALYYATFLRDEGFNTQYFRMAFLRNQLIILLGVMLSAVVLLVPIWSPTWFNTTLPTDRGFLCAVILFGVMGGAFSAITSLSRTSIKRRIPQHIVGSWVTVLRPTLGGVGALVAYSLLWTGILKLGELSAASVLLASFAAGFSERLVVRGVRVLTPEEPKEQPTP